MTTKSYLNQQYLMDKKVMIKRRRFLNFATSSLCGFSMAYLLGSCRDQSQQNLVKSPSWISKLRFSAWGIRVQGIYSEIAKF